MDPFFKAIGSAVGIMAIFFVAVIAGRLIASRTTKTPAARQASTALITLALFLAMFFATR